MRGGRLIHYLLALALCLGQIATNAHIIGHMHIDADHANANHAKRVQAFHLKAFYLDENTDHHAHNHHSQEDSNSIELNCVAYHAFAGLTGLEVAAFQAIAVHPSYALVPTSFTTSVFAAEAETQSIRGPPQYS